MQYLPKAFNVSIPDSLQIKWGKNWIQELQQVYSHVVYCQYKMCQPCNKKSSEVQCGKSIFKNRISKRPSFFYAVKRITKNKIKDDKRGGSKAIGTGIQALATSRPLKEAR